jgi:hypothetical protein
MNPRHLLLSKFCILNASAAGLVGAAYAHGYLDELIQTDTTHLCAAIGGYFVFGVGLTFAKGVWLAREMEAQAGTKTRAYLDACRSVGAEGRAQLASALEVKLHERIVDVRDIATHLVILGLIGTVLGILIALTGIAPSSAGDPNAIGGMVATLVAGFRVAFYTTLVGSVLNLVLSRNYRLLEAAAAKVWTHAVEQSEGVR